MDPGWTKAPIPVIASQTSPVWPSRGEIGRPATILHPKALHFSPLGAKRPPAFSGAGRASHQCSRMEPSKLDRRGIERKRREWQPPDGSSTHEHARSSPFPPRSSSLEASRSEEAMMCFACFADERNPRDYQPLGFPKIPSKFNRFSAHQTARSSGIERATSAGDKYGSKCTPLVP